MALQGEQSHPQRTFGNVRGHFWLSRLGEGTVVFSGQRPGKVLDTLQCTRQLPPQRIVELTLVQGLRNRGPTEDFAPETQSQA